MVDPLKSQGRAPKDTQASRVAQRFGGFGELIAWLRKLDDPKQRRSASACYRWNLPKTKGGTGGVIPSSAMSAVLAAADLAGVALSSSDLDVRSRT